MIAILDDLLGRNREQQNPVHFDEWFRALASVLHHISHLSPSLNFEIFCRHATDALCHGLSPLHPVAAHFHIDVCTSHLWLPDPTFKLDSYFRMQNRILMGTQTRPAETSREELHKTICYIPYELHKQAIEITLYHRNDSRPQQAIIAPVLEGFTRALTQALSLREDHLLKKVEWEHQVEKLLGARLADAIYHTNSPYLFAQSVRGFHLAGKADGCEHVFLNGNPQHEIYRALLLRMNRNKKSDPTASRTVAFMASVAAQLRLHDSQPQPLPFHELLQHFGNILGSLSHLLTQQDEFSFSLVELSQKSGVTKWHSAGFPQPVLFGKTSDAVTPPSGNTLKPYTLNEAHDWQTHQTLTLPVHSGILFFTDALSKRLTDIHVGTSPFFERLRGCSSAAQAIVEAEKILSKPDASRVVSASVTDWNNLPFDLSFLALYNNESKTFSER